MDSKMKQLTLLLPVWTRCSSATSVPVRAAGNNLDVLGEASLDLVGAAVLLESLSSSVIVVVCPHLWSRRD